MALIKCKNCGQMVSEKADKCPHCGYSISKNEVSDVMRHDTHKEKQIAKTNGKQILLVSVITFLAIALGGGVWWFLNNNEKNVKITSEFSERIKGYDELSDYHDGMAAVRKGDEWGFINTKGALVIPCHLTNARGYEHMPYMFYYSDGLIGVANDGWADDCRYGYMNKKGKVIIPMMYSEIHNFSEGLAAVCDSTTYKWGYINTKGKVVIPMEYIQASDFSCGIAAVIQDDSNKINFIDSKGNVVKEISSQYTMNNETLPIFQNGICKISDELWIDKKGNKVEAIQQEVEYYKESEENVSENGNVSFYHPMKIGLKDKKGNVVVIAKYSSIGTFSNGVALATLESDYTCEADHLFMYGYVDKYGNSTFSQDDYKKIAHTNKKIEERKKQEERRKWEEEQRKGPEWIDGTWYFEDNVNSSWGTMYMSARAIINRSNTSLIVYHGSDLDYSGNYTIRDNTIHYGNGNIIPMDVSN